MAVRHLGQGDGMVEDGPGPGEHIRQEFGNVGADWGDAPAQRDVAVEHPAQNAPASSAVRRLHTTDRTAVAGDSGP